MALLWRHELWEQVEHITGNAQAIHKGLVA